MNQKLQGWKLALALLIPAVIIGAAGFLAYDALTSDSQDIAIAEDTAQVETPATATAIPQTQAVAPTVEPTAAPPTAIPLPTQEPTVEPTVPAETEGDDPEADDAGDTEAEAEPAPAPAPTAVPAAAAPAPAQPAQPAAPAGPTATPTPDPDLVVISCSGEIPRRLEVGENFGPLQSQIVPAEQAINYVFSWDMGDTTTVGAPNTGFHSYDVNGSYTVTLRATHTATAEVLSTSCGTITVGQTAGAVGRVQCSVRPVDRFVELRDAVPGERMAVTVSWTPADVRLSLRYDFEATEPVVLVPEAASGDTQRAIFFDSSAAFVIAWSDPASGESGRLSCPAYPGNSAPFADATPAATANDTDGDGFSNDSDNCPSRFNDDQRDTDADGQGDVCDSDDDNDGLSDVLDDCPLIVSIGAGDDDGDGIGNDCDNCPGFFNPAQADADGNGLGDPCDGDADNDGVDDDIDNCPNNVNVFQLDTDGDGAGDECDDDADNDGFGNAFDNCPFLANPSQVDNDGDTVGDECEDDFPTPTPTP